MNHNLIFFIFLFSGLLSNTYQLNMINSKENQNLASNFLNSKINNFDGNLKNKKSSLYITAENNKSALINLKIKNSPSIFSIGLFKNKFVLMSSNDTTLLTVQPNGSSTIAGSTIMTNSIKVSGPINFNDQTQWRLIMHDSFQKNMTSLDWNFDKTTECNYHKILGGSCQISNLELIKKIENLPPHKMLRIEANFHFLGAWDSHTGYLKIGTEKNEKYIWAQRCKNVKSPMAVNIKLCGAVDFCKIGVPISSTINHSEPSIKLVFGSTLNGNPCDQSYGVSDIKVYIR